VQQLIPAGDCNDRYHSPSALWSSCPKADVVNSVAATKIADSELLVALIRESSLLRYLLSTGAKRNRIEARHEDADMHGNRLVRGICHGRAIGS